VRKALSKLVAPDAAEAMNATASVPTGYARSRAYCRYSVYLLYWYKSTDTDASSRACFRYSVYLLYWNKSTDTDANSRACYSSDAWEQHGRAGAAYVC
jgi:hypothetical protein